MIPAKIALIYAGIGIAWVFLSSLPAALPAMDAQAHSRFSLVNTLIFIGATAFLLYKLLRRHLDTLSHSEAARAAAEQKVHYMVSFDSVTNLPNRDLFTERLLKAVQAARSKQHMLAILCLNIDRFKHIDDTLGTAMGVLLLQAVAGRLGRSLHRGDLAARLGDHQFGILLPNVGDERQATLVAERLIGVLADPFNLADHEVRITAHAGISFFPNDGDTAEDLIVNADAAMRRALENSETSYRVYSAELHAAAVKRLELDNDLRRALDRRELVGHFQPCVDATTGRIIGAEVLARWHHPQRGLVLPAEFIPPAEKDGLIVQIGNAMLAGACAQNKAWQLAGYFPLRISVNLSAGQFEDPDLPRTVAAALDAAGLDADWLELEITESTLMNNARAAAATLKELKAMGVRVLMDDFGTGYSSLGALTQFAIDGIKLDKSFIQDLTVDPHRTVIIRAMTSMAHVLELKVIAEGVETEEQLDMLRSLNCDAIQGFYYSRPLPPAEFAKLLGGGGR